MKKIIISLILFTCISSSVFGQQDAMFTKYMFNSLVFNPAYAGSQGYWDANITYRNQWLSLEGAPTTYLLGFEGAVNESVGLGLTLFSDQIGVDKRTDASLNYAYHIRTTEGKLSFGIKVGTAFFRTDFADLDVEAGDPLYATDIKTTNPYAGFGLFYNSDNFYMGISSPTLISFDINSSDGVPKFIKPHIYISIGSRNFINENVELRPSIMGSFQKAAPPQAHLNLTAIFSNRFALGLSYRTGDALSFSAMIFVSKKFRIGASYDYTLSKLRTFNNGSVEATMGYSFGTQINKIQGVRNL